MLTRDNMNYRRAIQLLGQLEDRIGNCEAFAALEDAVHQAADSGRGWSFCINQLSKKLDEVANG